MNLANLVTLSRLPLLLVVIGIAYFGSPGLKLLNPPLVAFAFFLDWLDGYVARRRNECTLIGSILDIAVDRIFESVMWVMFVDLRLVPLWVPVVFIFRGFLVDSLREQANAEGESAYGMMRTEWGKFIVTNLRVRQGYALLKAFAFAWLLYLDARAPGSADWAAGQAIGAGLVYASVVVCVVRGVPVLAESFAAGGILRRAPSAS